MQSTLIRGGHVVTMDPELGDLPEADVLVRDGRIADIAPRIPSGGAEVVEAAGRIVVPGFVDAHRHVWQSLLHGAATDLGLPTYLRLVRGGYGGCFDADDAYLANLLGGLESISAGVTTLVDHSHLQTSPEISVALIRGLWDSGVGGYFAYGLQNAPDWLTGPPADADALTELFLRAPDDTHEQQYHAVRDALSALDDSGSNRLRLGVALPETAPYMTLDGVRALIHRARALDPCMVTAHWDNVLPAEYEHSPLAKVAKEGLLHGTTVLTHGNHLSDDELQVLAAARIGLVTTPGTESGMAMGPLTAGRIIRQGGLGALGTDSACYAQANLLGEARAWLDDERRAAHGSSGHLPEHLAPARRALELATSVGARTIGLDDEVGSLTVGKRANVTVVAPDPVRARPGTDPVATLVYYTDPGDVEVVLVDGQVRKRGGALTGVGGAELTQRCSDSLERIRSRFAVLPADAINGALRGIV